MNKGNIYYLMIGATNDLQKEVSACREAMNRWNDLNSFETKSVILPFHWTTSVYPNVGSSPQDVINNQIVENSDALICILKNRIGSPTSDFESGCIEEIELHRKSGKVVMVFFVNDDDHPLIEDDQYSRLIEYKKKYGTYALYVETSSSNIRDVIFDKLSLLMHKIKSHPSIIIDLLKPCRETQKGAMTLINDYVNRVERDYYVEMCSSEIKDVVIYDVTTKDAVHYGEGISDEIYSKILALAIKFGHKLSDFKLIRYDNQDVVEYTISPKYYVQIMRYSLSDQGYRDFSFDFFLKGKKPNTSHLYLACKDLEDIMQLFKYWFITLREYKDTVFID